jgi:inorganic pyrophosphatase
VKETSDLPALLIQQITHFFEHYKDLEDGKWVKVEGWGSAEDARKAITASVELFEKEENH